jgi:hypothetical protein
MTIELVEELFGVSNFARREATVSRHTDSNLYEILFAEDGKIVGKMHYPHAEDKAIRLARGWVTGQLDRKEVICQ